MKADIIIPCYNQLEYTKRCLWSIEAHTVAPYQLIVVDNRSTDGTDAYLWSVAAGHESVGDVPVKVITNSCNEGFARAVNLGLVMSDAPYVILLNNDVEVPAGWLETLIQAMEANPHIGAMGVLSTSQTQATWEGHFYSCGVQVIENYRLGQLPYSCAILRRKAIDQVGLLDEEFFLYGEDDDYNIRLIRAGWSLAIHTGVTVKHEHGATSTPGGFQHYRKAAMKRIVEKWGGPSAGSGQGPEWIDPADDPESRRSKAHLWRYEYARQFLRPDDVVLDVACGAGYGSQMMAEVCRAVHGVDRNQEALAVARTRYHTWKKTYYACVDLERIGRLPAYDVAVSFETIEHLADPQRFADLLKESAGRLIVLSTPCQDMYSPYHKHKYFTEEQVRVMFENGDWQMVDAMRQEHGLYGVYVLERRQL